jgi:hypothetical protein
VQLLRQVPRGGVAGHLVVLDPLRPRAGRFQVWSSNLFLLPFFGVLLPVQVARCSVCASLFCRRTSTKLYNAVNEPHAKQDRANNLHEGKQAQRLNSF